LLDLSTNNEFGTLAAVVGELQAVAGPLAIDFLLIGAAMRDVMLQAFGQGGGRRVPILCAHHLLSDRHHGPRSPLVYVAIKMAKRLRLPVVV